MRPGLALPTLLVGTADYQGRWGVRGRVLDAAALARPGTVGSGGDDEQPLSRLGAGWTMGAHSPVHRAKEGQYARWSRGLFVAVSGEVDDG